MFAVTRSSLWMAKDHLLYIAAHGYSEDYKRFYYRDIQAIITRETGVREVWTSVFVVLAACTALIFAPLALKSRDGQALWIVGGILCGILMLLSSINLLLGPTCATHLRTAVQVEQLGSLNRLRKARKAIGMLKPLIEQAQGGRLTADDIMTRATAMADVAARAPSYASTVTRKPAQRVHYAGTAHLTLFALLLVRTVMRWSDFFFVHIAKALASYPLFIGLFASIVIALVKQRNSDVPKAVQGLVWGSLAHLCVMFYVMNSYFQFLLALQLGPQAQFDVWERLKAVSAISPWTNQFVLVTDVISGTVNVLLAIFGLFLVRDFRRSSAIMAGAVPPPAREG